MCVCVYVLQKKGVFEFHLRLVLGGPGLKNPHYNVILLQMYNIKKKLKKGFDQVLGLRLCKKNQKPLFGKCHYFVLLHFSQWHLLSLWRNRNFRWGKWKNWNTFLSFCLAILSQIRSRGVASVLCNTISCISLLGIANAPLQKIKKACNNAVFPYHLSRHINISD